MPPREPQACVRIQVVCGPDGPAVQVFRLGPTEAVITLYAEAL